MTSLPIRCLSTLLAVSVLAVGLGACGDDDDSSGTAGAAGSLTGGGSSPAAGTTGSPGGAAGTSSQSAGGTSAAGTSASGAGGSGAGGKSGAQGGSSQSAGGTSSAGTTSAGGTSTGTAGTGTAGTGTAGTSTGTAGKGTAGTGAAGTGTTTQDEGQYCVDKINGYRATLGLPALARWADGEVCADGQAKSDSETMKAHGAFGQCKEGAQDECPGWPGPEKSLLDGCLQMMWDEGPGDDYSKHGHYINMSNKNYTKVACGFFQTSSGSYWAVQNFQ